MERRTFLKRVGLAAAGAAMLGGGEEVGVADVAGSGVLVSGLNARLVFDRLDSSDVGLTEDGNEGYGLAVGDEGSVAGTRFASRGSSRRALRASGARAEVQITEARIGASVGPDCSPEVLASDGGEIHLTGADFQVPCAAAMHVTGGASLNISESHVVAGPQFGVVLTAGGQLTDHASEFETAGSVALVGRGGGTRISLTGTRLRGAAADAAGPGVDLGGGAVLLADGLEVVDTGPYGVLVHGTDTRARLQGSTVARTRANGFAGSGLGLCVQGGGRVDAWDSTVSSGDGPALLVQQEGRLVGSDLRLEANAFSGALLLGGGSLDLQGGAILANVDHPGAGGGFGVYASGIDEAPVSLLLRDVDLYEHPLSALHLVGAGRFEVFGGTITGNPQQTALPDGLLASALVPAALGEPDPSHALYVRDVTFADVDLAVLLDQSSGSFDGCLPAEPEELLTLQLCDGVPPPEVDGQPVDLGCLQYPRPIHDLATYTLGLIDVTHIDSTGITEPFEVPGLEETKPSVESPLG